MGQKENKEKEKTARETLGKYFYDMSKLIFTAVVLTNITALFGLSNFAWKSAALQNIKEIIIWTQCYSQ